MGRHTNTRRKLQSAEYRMERKERRKERRANDRKSIHSFKYMDNDLDISRPTRALHHRKTSLKAPSYMRLAPLQTLKKNDFLTRCFKTSRHSF